MLFRIHFVTGGSYWAIQCSMFGAFWRTAKVETPTGDGPTTRLEPLRFETFHQASAHAEKIGLPQAYAFAGKPRYADNVMAGGRNYANFGPE